MEGVPVEGDRVAVARTSDATCASPLASDTTDRRGIFRLPRIEETHRVVSLVPFETFGAVSYELCAGSIDPAGSPIYAVRTTVGGTVSGDWLDCIEWQWHDRQQLSCSRSETGAAPRTFGDWAFGAEAGQFRVLPVMAGGMREHPYQLVVQWIARSPTGDHLRVRAQAELPLDPSEMDLRAFGYEPVLAANQWCLRVPSSTRSFWSGTTWLTIVLGEPGQLRVLRDKHESCGSASADPATAHR